MGSNEILDHFIAAFPSEHWYGLMKAQVLLINRQRQEAEWILDVKEENDHGHKERSVGILPLSDHPFDPRGQLCR